MILSELRQYLQQNKRASLTDMAAHFDTNPDALRGMLGKWISKGKMVKMQEERNCGSCGKCDFSKAEIYIWME